MGGYTGDGLIDIIYENQGGVEYLAGAGPKRNNLC